MSGGPNGYVIVPCALIRDTGLKPFDFRLLVLLMSFDFANKETGERKNTVWPGMGTLAELLGVHRNTVLGSLGRLEKAQYVVKVSGGGGRQRPNRYRLILHKQLCSIPEQESESAQEKPESAQDKPETAQNEGDKLHKSSCAGTLVKETEEETEEEEQLSFKEKGEGDRVERRRNRDRLTRDWQEFGESLCREFFCPVLLPTIRQLQPVGRDDGRFRLKWNARVAEFLQARAPDLYSEMLKSCFFGEEG